MANAQTQQGKKESANGSGATKTKKARGERKITTARDASIVVVSIGVSKDKIAKQEEALRVFAAEYPAEAKTLATTYNSAGAIFASVAPKAS